MTINYLSGWLKVGVEVDGVVVGLIFTDDKSWHPYPIYGVLTSEEQAAVAADIWGKYFIDIGR